MRVRSVPALAVLALVVTSGCLGALTGSDSLQFSSQPVSVSDAALSETDYELEREDTETINRSFTAGGQSRTVEVTNHVAEYARTVGIPGVAEGTLARFAVFSTPQVNILGETFNPVGDMSNRELAERLQSRYENVENVQQVSERSVRVVGPPATVTKFEATVSVDGAEVPIFLHVTKVQHQGDFVIAVAAHPQAIDEESRVNRLLGAIQHGQ